MQQAIDAFFDFNEGTVVGQVANFTFDDSIQRVPIRDQIPGVVLGLLHSEGDFLFIFIDPQDHHIDFVADLYQLAGMADPLGPRHLGDMDQALDTLFEFHEGTVVGDRDDFAANLGVDRIFFLDIFPRMRGQLLES